MPKTSPENNLYKPGDAGYNRRSGRKTLVLVAICIALIVLLSALSFMALLKNF